MGSELFSLLIRNEFPFPLAHRFREAADDEESREAACGLLLSFLEFAGVVLVADYLSGAARAEELDARLSELFQSPPSAGSWRDWSLKVLEHFAATERVPFLGSLQALLDRQARAELSRLIEARNRWVHGGARFDTATFRRDIFNLLQRVKGMHRSTLLCTESTRRSGPLHHLDVLLLKGDNPTFAKVECRSDLPLDTDRVYLYTADTRELLSLHPFFLCAECELCGGSHLFQYNRVSNRRVMYVSQPASHEKSSSDDLFLVEQMLRGSRLERLRPRHFSIPGEFSGVPRTLRPKDRVGIYEVEELIKLGGMSQIYRVTDTRTQKPYALKLLPIELSRDPVVLMRFEEEAIRLKRLDHPHVVAMKDLGEDFGDRYIVLDLVIAGTIESQSVRDLSDVRKPLSEETIVDIGLQICDGLQYIHSQGVVHRDLKPGNLLVSGKQILIGDFGVAHTRGDMKLTLTGMPVGTPEYMAPEQVREDEVDHRADIYSLGCILYELATGRPPFKAETPLTTALYHLQASPPRIEDLNGRISQGLVHVIYKALQKSPRHRYQSAADLFRDLKKIGADPAGPQVIEGDKAPQDALLELQFRERRRYRRRLLAWTMTTVAILTVLGAIGVPALYELWQEWRLQSWVRSARSAWMEGPESWPRACEFLQKACSRAPEHPRVDALLSDMFDEGRLELRVVNAGARIQVSPDPGEGRAVEFEARPEVLGTQEAVVPGKPIRLRTGHYRVTVEVNGKRVAFPVFVGRVVYQETPLGWVGSPILPRQALRAGAVEGRASGRFILAEAITIRDLVVPDEIPEGLVYVNPGPCWLSPDPMLSGGQPLVQPGSPIVLMVYANTQLDRSEMEGGFLISESEVTVEAFMSWLLREDLGRAYYRWRAERDAELEVTKEALRSVPLEIQRAWWTGELRRQGRELGDVQSVDALVDAALGESGRFWGNIWGESERGIRRRIEELLAKGSFTRDRPVPLVMREVALAYARTHAPVKAADFRTWLDAEDLDSRRTVERLKELRGRIAARSEPVVDRGLLPSEAFLGHPGESEFEYMASFSPSTVLEAYSRWLERQTYHAWQLPVAAMLSHVRNKQDRLAPGLRSQLDGIEKDLSDPSRWLWDSGNEGGIYGVRRPSARFGPIVSLYAADIEAGLALPDRENILSWLLLQTGQEERRAERLRTLRAGLEALDGETELKDLPFGLRLQHGWRAGWGLPTMRQWEKAFRGADARNYPWGTVQDANRALVGRQDLEVPLPVSAIVNDVSPYGVRALAGNLSEWVLVESQPSVHFAKGGNYRNTAAFANGEYYFSVEGGDYSPWIGFRVSREIGDPVRK